MTLTIAIQDRPGGIALPDLTARLTRAVFSTNAHGDEALQLSAPLSMASAFERYDRPGLPHAIVTDGAALPFQGRVEDVAIRGNGIDLSAYGYSRSLSDARYTALWSTTKVGDWRPVLTSEVANRTPELYGFDTNNRIQIALPQGSVYGNAANAGGMVYQIPSGSSRQIIGVSFNAIVTLPANWIFQFNTYQANFSGGTNLTIDTGIGGVQPVNKFYTFAGCDSFEFSVYNNTGGNYTVNNAPNVWSVRITNLRLVTTTATMINTTHTVARGAGVNVTATVGSTARMYVGQYLHIGATAALGEGVIVKQILNSTQFVADFTAAAAIGVPVQAFVIYADELVDDLVSTASTLNPDQLLSDTTQVQSPGMDLLDEVYEDAQPSTILDRLITMGDDQTPPRRWEWGVNGDRQLAFRPDGATAQTWYVDITALELQRTFEQLANSAYAVYQDASNRTLRSAVATDAASIARFGLTRQQPIKAQTTSLVQATIERDAALDDTADPPPRFGLTFTAVYNAGGGRVPLWLPRAGDTIVIRNLPPTVSVNVDQLRTFRIARTSCDLIARTLTIEPLVPLPTMASLIARGLRGQTT